MGLDITAYRKLSISETPALDESGYDDDGKYFHVSKSVYDFSREFGAGQEQGVEPGVYYDFEDSMGFSAGNYGGYNAWRNELAKFTGYTGAETVWANPLPGAPFVELIHFADNEGVIGPVVSAKLAKDFADHRERAQTHAVTGMPWFFDRYCEWQQAFEMAADGGAVEFH